MIKRLLFLFCAAIICMGAPFRTEAYEFGYGLALRGNALLMRALPGSVSGTSGANAFGISETALREYMRLTGGRVTVEAALETRGRFTSLGSGIGSIGGFLSSSGEPLERWDLTIHHTGAASSSIRTRVENLSIAIDVWKVDILVGRQPVSLGTSHFVSVLDVIAPFAPGYLDATYKPGVDALRVRTGIGQTGEAEIIAVGAKPWDNGALVGMVRTPVFGVDAVVLGGRFRDRGFGGIAWEGEKGPFAGWGELGLFERKPDEEPFFAGWSKAAFSGIAGTEVDVPYDIRTGFALMYQDFGARRPEDLPESYASAPFQEGWRFLGSAGYAVLTATRQLHPLVDTGVSGMVNLVDGSTLWQPRVTFDVSENSDLSLYSWISTGPGPQAAGLVSIPRSEFGLTPDGVGMYARWFF